MARRTINITDQLFDYMLSVGGEVPEVNHKLRDKTMELPLNMMQISIEQGRFMSLLIKLIGAKKTLEVGTFTGYSALVTAQALPTDGKLIACDVSDEFTKIGKPFWEEAGVAHKIDLRLAPAVETLDGMLANGEAGSFDFAFIDADKSNYDHYYERSLKLVRSGGLIAIDNVLWAGKVADDSVQDEDTVAIRALNAKVCADDRVDMCLVPIGDGLTLARVK